MDRNFYLDLAASGLRMPIAADLVLHEQEDPEAIARDGAALGAVIIATAQRFGTPLAFPLMDLRLEKEWLLSGLGVPAEQIDAYHFTIGPGAAELAALPGILDGALTPRLTASLDALRHVAANSEKVPVGMVIGPYSLATKLLADPITATYLLAYDPDDPDAQALAAAMSLAVGLVERSAALQVAAGARAVIVCEPAASVQFLSPKQLEDVPELLDRAVMDNLRRVRAAIVDGGADFILHDCGELNETLLRAFATLEPVILSLGSPVDLPTVTEWIPKSVVLFGNLPSKSFYSDAAITTDGVRAASEELTARMAATGHPFILGSECDVLSVPGHEERIMAKVLALAGR